MSAKITITRKPTEYYDAIKRIIDNAKAITNELNRRLARAAYRRIKEICLESVREYYASYHPHMYNRRKSLYNAYDIGIRNGDTLLFELGPDLMTEWHRVSSDYIYEVMFKEGWHGGARDSNRDDRKDFAKHPNPGTPYWRMPPTPRMMYIDEIDELHYVGRWKFWYPQPAVRSAAPYDMITNKWNKYLDGEYQEIKKNAMLDVLSRYIRD